MSRRSMAVALFLVFLVLGALGAQRDSAVLLPNGQVLVSGGEDNRASFHTLTSAELYTLRRT